MRIIRRVGGKREVDRAMFHVRRRIGYDGVHVRSLEVEYLVLYLLHCMLIKYDWVWAAAIESNDSQTMRNVLRRRLRERRRLVGCGLW